MSIHIMIPFFRVLLGQLINLIEQKTSSSVDQNKIEELFYETIKQFNLNKELSTYTYCDGFAGLG